MIQIKYSLKLALSQSCIAYINFILTLVDSWLSLYYQMLGISIDNTFISSKNVFYSKQLLFFISICSFMYTQLTSYRKFLVRTKEARIILYLCVPLFMNYICSLNYFNFGHLVEPTYFKELKIMSDSIR